MIIRNLKVTIDRDEVFRQIDCYENSDLYEEVIEEYEEIIEDMYALCEPVCLLTYKDLTELEGLSDLPKNHGALMMLYSIGKGMSTYSTKCFQEGDYLKGMLSDAMADSALFSLEKEIQPFLKEACKLYKKGISHRMEAPQDIPMEMQKLIFEEVKAKKHLGMDISSGYMLDPVKSNAVLYLLTDDQAQFATGHDCRKCKNITCIHRNVPDMEVKVKDGDTQYSLFVKERQSILEALITADQSFGAVCGGAGKCGKCKIQVLEGNLAITDADKTYFSEDDLKKGLRLSCKSYPTESVAIKLLFAKEKEFCVVTDYLQPEEVQDIQAEENYGIAIDIGTTTIALQVVGLDSGKVISTYTSINHQRNYGADVISRIKASVEGKSKELKEIIQKDLLSGMKELLSESKVSCDQIKRIVISGNTTMIHLLMGYDCKGLGEYPFTPINVNLIEVYFSKLLDSSIASAKVEILPGISAFVGGDIVSGLYACDADTKEEYSLLIDLGTNGEIALGNKDKIMVTSTAAGPAFEGGNISCGVGSIEGAISNVSIVDGKADVITIGNKPPTGICGTGVVETAAELVKHEIVDETGCLDEQYFEDGFLLAKSQKGDIVFTQQDVREIQLAKAAVRAGIETLCLRYGIKKEDISKVYVAGGFGYRLDCRKAIEIGMIPQEFQSKIKAVGNSSLNGAVKYLLKNDAERVLHIGNSAEEINLSADKDFNQFYMEYMYFE